MWMTRLALPGKWPFLGESGLSVGASSANAWPIRSASIRAPMPMPPRQSSSRRLINGSIRLPLVDEDELIGLQEHVDVFVPRRHRRRRLRGGAAERGLRAPFLLAHPDG